MQDYADNTNQVLSAVLQTGTDRESAHMVIPQLSRSTVCYHHPVHRQSRTVVFGSKDQQN